MRYRILVHSILVVSAVLTGCGSSNKAIAPDEFSPKPPAEEMMDGKKSVQPKETG